MSLATAQPVERFFQFSLLGLLASGYLAVLSSGTLDLPTAVVTAAALILRGLMIVGLVRFRIPEQWVAAASLGYIGFYPIDYFFISGEFLPATVHFIFLLAILRILSARTPRDYAFVKLIAFLEILAASVVSSGISFFAFLIAFLVFGVATFASSEIRRSLHGAREVARFARPRFYLKLSGLVAGLSVAILLLTSALFFLLPRTAQAAFRHLVSQRYFLPGFSNEVTLGQIGELKMQNRTVMHVRVDGQHARLPLKWRGGALSEFDGRRWYNSVRSAELLPVEQGLVRLSQPAWSLHPELTYEVRVKALETDALFLTGEPEFLRANFPRIVRGPGESFRSGLSTGSGLHYFGLSRDNRSAMGRAVTSTDLTPPSRELNLRLPRVDPRLAALARKIASTDPSPFRQAEAVERHLRRNYGYTTELLSEPVADPLAHFLFERKRGHCEYFASAMAVMLRSIGIPARMATGFQSGVFNELTGWTLIRAADAHSWVEAWIDGYGWTAFDPTPPDPRLYQSGLIHRLTLYLDAAETFWQEWVLNYDLERQITLASRMESTGRLTSFDWLSGLQSRAARWAAYSKGIIIALVIVAALAALLRFWGPSLLARLRTARRERRLDRGDITPHDATLLYGRMLRALARRGIEKPAWLTPAEFARVIPQPSTALLVQQITFAYNELRFGSRHEAGGRMLALVRNLEDAAEPRK